MLPATSSTTCLATTSRLRRRTGSVSRSILSRRGCQPGVRMSAERSHAVAEHWFVVPTADGEANGRLVRPREVDVQRVPGPDRAREAGAHRAKRGPVVGQLEDGTSGEAEGAEPVQDGSVHA